MIEYISDYFAKFLCSKNTSNSTFSNNDDFEIIKYGIECIINILIPIIVYFIFSTITHNIINMLIWLPAFLFLRNYIGGYHASSHIRCIIFSSLFGILCIWVSSILTNEYLYIKISIITTCLILYLIEGPILQNETYLSIKNSLYIKGLIVFILECFFMLLLFYFNIKLGNCFFLSILGAYILYVTELTKRKI